MNLKPLLGGVLAMALWASTASAAYIYVDLTNPTTSTPAGIGNVLTYDLGNGLTMTVTSWSTTGSGGTLEAARTAIWGGGLGVCNEEESCQSSPNHAMDNSGNKDFLLFGFNMTVDPYKLKIGWYSEDDDLDYWIGSESSPTMTGLALANLGTEGFGPMQSYDGSSTWVDLNGGAGLSLFVGTELQQEASACGRRTCYDEKDYVKIQAIKVDFEPPPPQGDVPEPSTYALVGSALIGVAFLRRKRS